MTIEEFKQLETMVTEYGQKLVKIDLNTWVDYETYRPKTAEEIAALQAGQPAQ